MYMCFIANMQDICNLIGREEYNVGRIVISVTILHSDQKKKKKLNNIRLSWNKK